LEKKGKGREVEREEEGETRVLQYAALRLNEAQNKNSEGSILALSPLEIPIFLRLSALPIGHSRYTPIWFGLVWWEFLLTRV